MTEEKQALVRHLRRHHPNLLLGTVSSDEWDQAIKHDRSLGFADGAMPENLNDVPMVILSTVHAASHMGLFFPHDWSDWVCRDHEADDHYRSRADAREAS